MTEINNKTEHLSPDNFPFELPDSIGKVVAVEEECPGVYYLAIRSMEDDDALPAEYYAVCVDAKAISEKAKSYGQKISGQPMLLLYELDIPNSGHMIVDYEVCRYRVQHGIPLQKGGTLLSCARYGAIEHPEYFGEIPPPLSTPWGDMTRHQRLIPGVFWLETDQGQEGLCVYGPLWECELSDHVQLLAISAGHEEKQGLGCAREYAFYAPRDSCLPIFELEMVHEELDRICDRGALMNAIWRDHPEYAAAWNMREMYGFNDMPGLLFRALGIDVELRGSADRTIQMTEGRSCDFLLLE